MAMTSKDKLKLWLGSATALAAAAAFISSNEGTVYKVYRDPVGILTACTGETGYVVTPGDIKLGNTFTPAQCTEALYRSMAAHAEPVMRCTAPAVLTAGQKLAYLDFAFNVGGANFCSSTLARKARLGDVQGSCSEFFKWKMAQGVDCSQNPRVCGGVWTRRGQEYDVCLG